MKKNRKYFLGWGNIKWIIIEIIKIYSSEKSFFSKKRIESGFAFLVAQSGMIFFLLKTYHTLSMGEFMLWAAAEFAVSGYIVNKIQSEKRRREDYNDDNHTNNRHDYNHNNYHHDQNYNPNPNYYNDPNYYNYYNSNNQNYINKNDPSNYNPNDPNYYNPNDPPNYTNDYNTDDDPRKR